MNRSLPRNYLLIFRESSRVNLVHSRDFAATLNENWMRLKKILQNVYKTLFR